MAQADRLGQYRIQQCTSKGQLSEVYEAVHLETSTPVAIKKIRFLEMHAAMQRECETEINLLQALDHPHLIKYYEHFSHEGELLVVMELAAGGTLAPRAAEVRRTGSLLEEGLLWRWLCDTASALAYLHRHRVLHRDVKPSHIFLGESGQAKLGDFGLSKSMSTQTNFAFSCVGTPFYMSPEIVKGEGYSFGSDVWSLGCSLYELAAGYPPFYRSDMNFKALGDAICSAQYPPLQDEAWSSEFAGIIRRILTVDTSLRPDAQEVLDATGRRLVARIQDFEILGTIGRGRFSEVHRSIWHAGGGREVALKRIQFFDMDSEARRQCRAEVSMLKNMDHHRIIRYLDSFIQDSELVIVLELAPHGDLAGLCGLRKREGGALAEEQVLAIFLQVCDALCYMHRNRMMHRDIKPANIFICGQGNVKLGDLGLGRYFSSNTDRAHSVVGTPFYMSPEVIGNGEGYGFTSDIWSLGCVLYELSALDNPFSSSRLNYYMLGKHICNAEYPDLPEGTSERVRGLVGQMIQVDREARPDAAAVFAAVRRHFAQCAQMPEDPCQRLLRRASEKVKAIVEPSGLAASTSSPVESPAPVPVGGMVASPVTSPDEPPSHADSPPLPPAIVADHQKSLSMSTPARRSAPKQQLAHAREAAAAPHSPWQPASPFTPPLAAVTPPSQASRAAVTSPPAPPHGAPPPYSTAPLAAPGARTRAQHRARGPADGPFSARGISHDGRPHAGHAQGAGQAVGLARRARTPPSRTQAGLPLLPPILRPQELTGRESGDRKARAAYPIGARDPAPRAHGGLAASAPGALSARTPGPPRALGGAGSQEAPPSEPGREPPMAPRLPTGSSHHGASHGAAAAADISVQTSRSL